MTYGMTAQPRKLVILQEGIKFSILIGMKFQGISLAGDDFRQIFPVGRAHTVFQGLSYIPIMLTTMKSIHLTNVIVSSPSFKRGDFF